MEKLEIMIMLVSERNVEQVLLEFKEYATEVDVEFVRKAVRAIGRCAIKLEKAAERCINVLLELIQTKVNYVVQEAVIVIKDIFRKYPNKYESIIATLCENLDTLDEPEAKASMIWIIGEYAERIDNADELLEAFIGNFKEENAQVQLQLLTATVKLFLKKPKNTQKLVQRALDLATQYAICCVGLSGRSANPALGRLTTPICATAATCTGVCCRPTPRRPRQWCWARSRSSPTILRRSTRRSSTS